MAAAKAASTIEAGPAGTVGRRRIGLLLALWIGPYALLAGLRYGLGHSALGSPAGWMPSLAGLQLFASVGLLQDLLARRIVLVVALLFYVVFFSGVFPDFAAVGSAFPLICIAALMALAVWLPFSSGQLSLAQAGFMALGAYGAAWLTVEYDWPFAAALGAGAVGTALVGLAVSYPALRLRGIYLAIATLGLGEVIRIFFLNLEATGGAFGFTGIPRYTELWHLVLALLVVSCLIFALMRGRIGRAITAVRQDQVAAASMGIEITRIRVLTFTLGAFLAGLAGGFQAHYVRFIAPENFDVAALIEWLTMVMLGGFETFIGVLTGTLVIGAMPEMLHFLSEWRLTIDGVILIVLLIFRPQGIVTRDLIGWRHAPSPARLGRHLATPAPPPALTRSNAPADILTVDGLSKRFGGITALDGVSIAVRRNEIHAVIGPNGAGKTTLFNIMTGLYSASGGSIRFSGEIVDGLSPQQMIRLGMARTFQNIRLFGELTVLENVMLGAHVRTNSGALSCAFGLDRREEYATAAHALELLRILGLTERAHHPAGSLPYGDQRRLEIARALASDPVLLLLDEPAAGMNKAEAVGLAQIIREVRAAFGITVVLIDHDMEFVMPLCDRVTVLNFGLVITAGDPATVQRNEAVVAAYLGSAERSARPGR